MSRNWENRWPDARPYALILGAIKQALCDALSGIDPDALCWLFEPSPQNAISRMLGRNDEATWKATQEVALKVEELVSSGQAADVRRWLSYRRKDELRRVFG